jgi:hypothetical protein
MRARGWITAILLCMAGGVRGDCFELYRGDELVGRFDYAPFDISMSNDGEASEDLTAARNRGELLVIVPGSCHVTSIPLISGINASSVVSAGSVKTRIAVLGGPQSATVHAPRPSNSMGNVPPIHVGPRGGKYYFTSSEKKRYLSQD